MTPPEGFHYANWHFTRRDDGAVYVTVYEDPRPGAPVAAGLEFPAEAWVRLVASVSARGENSLTLALARAFHTAEGGGAT